MSLTDLNLKLLGIIENLSSQVVLLHREIEEWRGPEMNVKAYDCVKVPEKEWDQTPPEQREPYVEELRKNGFVYAIRKVHGK